MSDTVEMTAAAEQAGGTGGADGGSALNGSFIDPAAAVQAEVERGVESMVEQHTQWLELCAAGQRGEEYDWRTAELLSCLRAIEWDLQDLEDHVSIVEGNRAKFEQIDDDFLAKRKALVESVRRKIDFVRESVQEAANAEGGQLASSKASRALAAIRAARGQKGYGKLKEQAGRGSGVFSAGGGASGSSKSNPPTASDGAPMSRTADGNDSHAVAMASTSAGRDDDDFKGGKRWWLCCC